MSLAGVLTRSRAEPDGLGDGRQLVAIDAIGHDQPRQRQRGLAIAVEAVALQQPGQRGEAEIVDLASERVVAGAAGRRAGPARRDRAAAPPGCRPRAGPRRSRPSHRAATDAGPAGPRSPAPERKRAPSSGSGPGAPASRLSRRHGAGWPRSRRRRGGCARADGPIGGRMPGPVKDALGLTLYHRGTRSSIAARRHRAMSLCSSARPPLRARLQCAPCTAALACAPGCSPPSASSHSAPAGARAAVASATSPARSAAAHAATAEPVRLAAPRASAGASATRPIRRTADAAFFYARALRALDQNAQALAVLQKRRSGPQQRSRTARRLWPLAGRQRPAEGGRRRALARPFARSGRTGASSRRRARSRTSSATMPGPSSSTSRR